MCAAAPYTGEGLEEEETVSTPVAHLKGSFASSPTRALDHRRDITCMHAHALFMLNRTKRRTQ